MFVVNSTSSTSTIVPAPIHAVVFVFCFGKLKHMSLC